MSQSKAIKGRCFVCGKRWYAFTSKDGTTRMAAHNFNDNYCCGSRAIIDPKTFDILPKTKGGK